jgi:hypothetical protein
MKHIAIAIILIAPSAAAYAGTNFPALSDYPAPNCAKAEKPTDVPGMKMSEDPVAYNKRIRQHNDQIVQYNTALHDYTNCMNDYVANAQADMDAIRVKVNKAVADGKTSD